jgi:tetratricopeptide (TPR) repeat protein
MSLPLMAEGEFALVRDYLEAAGNKPVSARGLLFHDNELYAMHVDLATRRYDETDLRHYAPLAQETADRDGHQLYQAVAHRAWGVLHRLQGEHGAAERRLRQALALFQELETRWQIGRTLFELAALYRTMEQMDVARDYLAAALAVFEEMGAMPDLVRTQAALASLS